MPRRGVGARAATELDVAMARRRASGRALFARLVDDDRDVSFCGGREGDKTRRRIRPVVGGDGGGGDGNGDGDARARRFLARWTRRRGASRSKRVEDDGELRLSADAPADPNEEEMDDDEEI